ncbi:hypothetical protein [Escherichia phage rV5_ev147]|nr:hypothetical protein [Escherichia phage rV5_ev147]VVA46276.1 hypothetical protein [Escherichia phage rV5_ev156]
MREINRPGRSHSGTTFATYFVWMNENTYHCENCYHYGQFNIIPIMRTTGDTYKD